MYDFSDVLIHLVEPCQSLRSELRFRLKEIGVKDVVPMKSLDEMKSTFQGDRPDIVIIDADGKNNESIEFIKSLRHMDIDYDNPFIPTVFTGWNLDGGKVSEIASSGADRIIQKPASAGEIVRAVIGLAKDHKHYDITESYIGPVRRQTRGRKIQVPNTLAKKLAGEEQCINELKDARNSVFNAQIGMIGEYIKDRGAGMARAISLSVNSEAPDAFYDKTKKFGDTTKLLEKKLIATGDKESADLCKSLNAVLERAANDSLGSTKEAEVIFPLTQAINASIKSTDRISVSDIKEKLAFC